MDASQAITIAPPQTSSIPYPIERTGQYIMEIGKGALTGGAISGVIQLLIKGGVMSEIPGQPVGFLPYILAGAIYKGIIETATLIYEIGQSLLGERARYEILAPSEERKASDSLRNRCCKVIGKLDKFQSNIDGVFSRVFGIRTAKEMRENRIFERDFYQENRLDLEPRHMETVRHFFWVQMDESLKTSFPQFATVKVIEALGLSILGPFGSTWFQATTFFLCLVMKFHKYHAILQVEEQASLYLLDSRWADAEKVYKLILANDASSLIQSSHNLPSDMPARSAMSYLAPEKITAWEGYLISLLNQSETKWEDLENRFQNAVAAQPNNRVALAGYAFCLCKGGKAEEAEKLVNTALESDPKNLWLLSLQASMLNKQEKFDEASEAIKKASAIEHSSPYIKDALLLMYNQLDKPIEQPVVQPAEK